MARGGKQQPEDRRLRDVTILSSLSDEEIGALASAVNSILATTRGACRDEWRRVPPRAASKVQSTELAACQWCAGFAFGRSLK